jgi:lysophospholipase L1-like esterase
VPVTADGKHGIFQIPPQSSQLQQFPDLKVVVVAFGPNDLGWTTQLGLFAAQQGAGAAPDVQRALGDLATSVWEARRSQFLVDLNLGLLPQLAEVPSRPAIIVLGSYDLFADQTQAGSCPEAAGLSQQDLQIIHERNVELNDLLAAAVKDANRRLAPAEPRFTFAQPRLAPLCSPASQAAPDLHGLTEGYPLHPTALGEAHIVAAVQPDVAAALTTKGPSAPSPSPPSR